MIESISVLLPLVFLCDIALCYNIDVKFPILYKGPNNAHFGYSVAIRENWIQVGAPKGSNPFLPQVTDPGAVYKCPFKNSCNVIDINSMNTPGKDHRKANGWLGGAMDVSTSTHSYAVCSHRMINQKWNSYYMIGSCYWGHSQANMQPQYVMTPLDDHEIYTLQESTANSNPVSVYDWGNGLAGMSVHIPKNLTNGNMQLVIGAPGVFNLRGAVILYRNLERGLGQPLVTNPYKTIGGPIDDDYVGYQVSSGYFYNRDKVLYVASAPRSMYKGKVIIFEFARTTREAMIIKQELVGQTIGEYFGASIASGDLDNDGLDDLVIGAPQWSSVEDEGRIYVYMGSNTGRLSLSISFDGSVKGAMFGYAVQFLGDVDGDGYNDLAVGAPYDDDFRGALYVYYGGPSGLSAARSTRISASVLSPELKGFGVSFSKAEDLDNNGYGDFAVGSFISGHAVLLRSKPVMDVMVSIKTKSNSLDHSATQFEIDLCVFYSGRGLPTDMVVIRNVSADAAFGRVTLSKTGRFQNEANVKVAINRETCETITFDLKAKNNFEPMEIISSYSLLPESNYSSVLLYGTQNFPNYDGFCTNCPVMRLGSKTRASATISFASNCGNDGQCTSDLHVDVKFNGTTKMVYILGSDKTLQLEVEVHNKGESAYSTQLHVKIPKPVDLESIPSSCQQDDDAGEYNIAITCFVANPLYNDKRYFFTLPLDMSKVGLLEDYDMTDNELLFNVAATTISSNIEKNNIKDIAIQLKNEFDITVTGKTPQDALSYDTPDNETAVELLRFQHNFIVQKFGASPVHQAALSIIFPYAMHRDKNEIKTFLVVHSNAGSQDGQPLQCTSNQINYHVENEYSTEDFDSYDFNNETEMYRMTMPRSRKTRDVSNYQESPENRTLLLNCNSPSFLCYEIKCQVGPFFQEQTVVRLSIDMAMNVSVLKEILDDNDVALFSSIANVNVIRPFGLEQTATGGILLRPDDFVLSTLFSGSPKNGTIVPWIIAVAVAVGLLLLGLVIAGLVKAGFFKRTTKEELEALKEADQSAPGISEEEALAHSHDVENSSEKEEA